MVSTSNAYLLREFLFPFGLNVVEATLCIIIAIAEQFTSVFFTAEYESVSADSRNLYGPVEVFALQITQFNMIEH